MSFTYLSFFLSAFLLISANGVSFASDSKRESGFAEELEKTNTLGKMVWLDSEGTKFLGLYTESDKKENKGTVIILHDQGGHPNQLQLINHLRTYLPEHHWATLSLQMPVRELGAKEEEYYELFPEAMARIESGIKYLQQYKANNIVVTGYGLGALMAVYAQSEKPSTLKALVAISLPVPSSETNTVQTIELIKKIKVPLLDIYAEKDIPAVSTSARDRRIAARENPGYRQVKINDENHLYQHEEGFAVKLIYSWIEKTVGSEMASDVTETSPAANGQTPSP